MGEGGCSGDCQGAPFPPFTKCFAHLSDQARSRALRDVGPGSDVNLSGTTITGALLAQLLDAVRDDDGRPTFGDAQFSGATFVDAANFEGSVFRVRGNFFSVRFEEPASFRSAQFEAAGFARAAFLDEVDFFAARFASALFSRTGFFGDATFNGADFGTGAEFDDSVFEASASFATVDFGRSVSFENVSFARGATFGDAQLPNAEGIGPLYSDEPLDFDRATLGGSATIDAFAPELSFVGTRFDGPTVLRLQGANVWLDGAILGDSLTVVSAAVQPAETGAPWASSESLIGTSSIGSLRGVDAGKLVLSGVDLSRCRFAGAYNLDQISIEGRCRFADVPRGLRWRRGWPPVWWWTKRQTIMEEHRWRARDGRIRAGWTPVYPERPESSAGWRQPTHPERLSAIYRQLRKALEDAKNEPGAADFYYGETDLRRLSPSTPRSERFVLTLYWLFSGYGLRASRALLGLAALVGVTTWLLVNHGLAAPDATTEEALRSALNAVVFRSDEAPLTTAGTYIEMVARVFGPILLALAALSVRNRVKR